MGVPTLATRILVGVAFQLLVALAGESRANPACPVVTLFCYNHSMTSTDPQASCTAFYGNSNYDLVRGTIHDDSRASCGGDCYSAAYVDAQDQYHVEGLPAGTPLTFRAELVIGLSVAAGGCGLRPGNSSAYATLNDGSSNRDSASVSSTYDCFPQGCCTGQQILNRVLGVTITRAAGEVFDLFFKVLSNGSTIAIADGQLRFSGLPPGASVVSCQGFRQDIPTASRPVSWGRLKQHYR